MAFFAIYLGYELSRPEPYEPSALVNRPRIVRAQTRELGELTLEVDAFFHSYCYGVPAVLRCSKGASEDQTIRLEVRSRQQFYPEYVMHLPALTILREGRQANVDYIIWGPEYRKFYDAMLASPPPGKVKVDLHIIAKIQGSNGEEQVTFTPNLKILFSPFPSTPPPPGLLDRLRSLLP